MLNRPLVGLVISIFLFDFYILVPYRDFFTTLAHVTGGQYVPMTDAARLAQMIIGGVREEISIDRLMTNSRKDIVREMRKATADRVDDHEAATRLQRLFSNKNVSVSRMNNGAGTPSRAVEECYTKCSDMTDIQRQYKQNQTVSHVRPTNTDYQLEENKTVSIDQAKRIVQKAKNWDYSAEDLNEERKRTDCKWGSKCRDDTSYHRAKYAHPPVDDHSTRRSHDNRRDDPTAHDTQPFSNVRDHERKTDCKFSSRCTDHSDSHRERYAHPQDDHHSIRRGHDTRSDDHPTRHNFDSRSDDHTASSRQFNSHVRDRDQRTECKHGAKCYDHSDYHRTKYSHPSTRH